MGKVKNSICIAFSLLIAVLTAYMYRSTVFYPVLAVLAMQASVFFLSGRRDLLTFGFSLVPAILLLPAFVPGKAHLFWFSLASAVVIVVSLRVLKSTPRYKTDFWVGSLLILEALVFAILEVTVL